MVVRGRNKARERQNCEHATYGVLAWLNSLCQGQIMLVDRESQVKQEEEKEVK